MTAAVVAMMDTLITEAETEEARWSGDRKREIGWVSGTLFGTGS